ncbi:MAG: hypothetical protein QW520_01970 [Methanomassiliicoccales archaeon]
MRTLITMMGRSIWGLFNSVWASVRAYDYLPDRVYILTAGCDKPSAEKAAAMIRILLQESDSKGEVMLRIIPEEDVVAVADEVRAICTEERRSGNEVSLDVTPGTKVTVLGSVITGMARNEFQNIFYLYIEDLRNAARPYLEIPLMLQHPHEILREVKGKRNEGGRA